MKVDLKNKNDCLNLYLKAPGISSMEAFEIYDSIFKQMGMDLRHISVHRRKEPVEELEARLKKKEDLSFSISLELADIDFDPSEGRIAARFSVQCAECWYEKLTELLIDLVSSSSNFVMAIGYDNKYWIEQGEIFLENRIKNGYTCDPKRFVPTQHGDPLEPYRYDINGLAGLMVYRKEYVEVPAAHMWLGEPFWGLTGANKADVLAADWLKTEQLDHGVLYVEAWPHLFNLDQGEQGRRQRKLRKLLYPKSEQNQYIE
jgi:hypothetical protein